MKFSEKWLREWVNPSLSTQELAQQLTMAGLEVDSIQTQDQDKLIEIDLTPNRGDCLGILGIARELGALNGIPLTKVQIEAIPAGSNNTISVVVNEPKSCPRYVGRLINQIRVDATTPQWIQERLAGGDIRSLHPVVDILNYVMLELGQPMHAFDADKIQAPIIVRNAKGGEKISLLDGQEISLRADTLVIADSDRVQAIAGIMGGNDSAVSTTTQNIFLESALFAPSLMAGKARFYNLHTDSSYRFERGVDPSLQVIAIERATKLITEVCGGTPGPVIDVVKSDITDRHTTLRFNRVEQLLGAQIDEKTIVDILERLGCEVTKGNEKSYQVKLPSFRYDLTEEIDLIEEIIRVVGYNTISNTLPTTQLQFVAQPENSVPVGRIKRAFVDMGYQEAITYSFVDENLQKMLFPQETALALVNPISADMGVMRISMWPGLLKVLQFNQNRQQQRMKFFEVGLCFKKQQGLEQVRMLSGLVYGNYTNEHWDIKKRPSDFFDIKQHIEAVWELIGHRDPLQFVASENTVCHPGQCADIFWEGKLFGTIGKLHPKIEKELSLDGPIYLFEIKLDLLLTKPLPVFKRPSRFPEIRRDIAMIVDDRCSSDSLINFVRKSTGEVLREVKIFDVYTGKGIDSGRKSIAMGLILQHPSRTLVDKEVDDLIHTLVVGLKKEFGAELRD